MKCVIFLLVISVLMVISCKAEKNSINEESIGQFRDTIWYSGESRYVVRTENTFHFYLNNHEYVLSIPKGSFVVNKVIQKEELFLTFLLGNNTYQTCYAHLDSTI